MMIVLMIMINNNMENNNAFYSLIIAQRLNDDALKYCLVTIMSFVFIFNILPFKLLIGLSEVILFRPG